MSELPPAIKSDDDLNRVAAHWIGLRRRSAEIFADERVREAQAVVATAAVRKKEIDDELLASDEHYRPMIKAYAAKRLRQLGGRTYEAALMKVKLIAVSKTTVDVQDERLALSYLIKHCPEAIENKPKIVKSGFTTAFLAAISKLSKAGLRKAGLGVTLPHDNMVLELK